MSMADQLGWIALSLTACFVHYVAAESSLSRLGRKDACAWDELLSLPGQGWSCGQDLQAAAGAVSRDTGWNLAGIALAPLPCFPGSGRIVAQDVDQERTEPGIDEQGRAAGTGNDQDCQDGQGQ